MHKNKRVTGAAVTIGKTACHKATTCEDNIDELHYCWNCGAKMKGGEE